jgi:hypothetical protein
LIDFSAQRRKQAIPPKAKKREKNRIQNSEYRTQNTASIKIKTITKSTPPKAEKMLFNRLFDLDLLDLKPCPAGRFVVCLLANWREF